MTIRTAQYSQEISILILFLFQIKPTSNEEDIHHTIKSFIGFETQQQ